MAHSAAAHYDIYRDRLAATHPIFGHALWEPGPEVGYGPVKIGDVGYVRDGKFHRLFNALLPADDVSHEGTTPPGHEPLIPKVQNHISTGALKPNNYCSAGVNILPAEPEHLAAGPQDYPQLSFSCTRRRGGAVLSLPVDAQRQDTRARGDFGKWILKHIDSWFSFARGLGLGIDQMEEIILVTGCHRTRSWANVAFLEDQAHSQASFGIMVASSRGRETRDVSIKWQFSLGNTQGAVCNWGPEGEHLPEDQCIFIRGFRAVRVFGIFPKLRGAAGPDPSLDEDEGDGEPDKELISIPAVTKTRDPLHVLLDYVVQRSPNCNMVLVHDDDLARIALFRDTDALMTSLQLAKPEIHQMRCNFLSTNENCTGTATVAMFLEEFHEWNLAPTLSTTVAAPRDDLFFYPGGSPVDAPGIQNRRRVVRSSKYRSALTPTPCKATIDHLPDSVLLDIFDFYCIIPTFPENVYSVWGWHVLVHVCRRWRLVVFASPARLGLRLRCTPMTPVRKMLDIWPPLPIIVDHNLASPRPHPYGGNNNLIAALEQHDRVCVITINRLKRYQLELLTTAMQDPFPALTHLFLGSDEEALAPPALPATFMGGSAPRLQRLALRGISFPALPRFVLSPNDLTSIELRDIPSTSYISPVAMVALLSTLTRLGHLIIEFKSPIPPFPAGPTSRTAIPLTRTLLLALVYFRFKGVSEYLEDMVSRIDTPLLSDLDVEFFNELIFDIPQLSLFVRRTGTLKSHCKQAELLFKRHHVLIKFSYRDDLGLSLCIPCSPSDWQLSSVVQLCGPPFPLSWNVERLDIADQGVDTETWQDNIDRTQWLEILRLFTSVQELYVTEAMWHILAPDLNEHTGERTMDVLPMLRDLFLERLEPSKPLPKTIEPFIAARKLTGHLVVVHRREEQGWKTVD